MLRAAVCRFDTTADLSGFAKFQVFLTNVIWPKGDSALLAV